ncbi:MAG: GIY-YIG nuclease family protein [bacterium]|nr:GIY-YIG nuclease family protein [bacterium]
MEKQYFVYILTNYTNRVLYTGITNNITRRIYEHKNKFIPGFTAKYNVNKLVFVTSFSTALEAINAEKKIKGWTRIKKLSLIKRNNPTFQELPTF